MKLSSGYIPVSNEEGAHTDAKKRDSEQHRPSLEYAYQPSELEHNSRYPAWHYVFHALFVAANLCWTLVLVSQTTHLRHDTYSGDVPSPANNISLERVVMNNSLWDENRFKGPPNPDQTQAWLEFFNLTSIAVSREDLDAIDRTSVQLTSGPNRYLAMLDVFHQIHCLDKIRIYLNRDYYTLVEHPTMQLIHVHHCLDSLRQIAMCRGDTELVTFQYVSEEWYPNPRPNPDFLVERKCRNWDQLVEWVSERRADVGDAESREVWEGKYGKATSHG
ncbi:hypothetical protein BDV96DRAFT_582848 [Lophiotrema nucula]|uniref:Tat pathway signal sequence n=1 Tax=Lophiotrema nucula TaxID=690887 RepID=A0A6A5YYX2_9PLEO|nr:hypothetical protein BDV96DRAFT_582848 [Lophiotrema nucula]